MDFITDDIIWDLKNYQKLLNYLNSLKDEDYKKFNQKLITTKYPMVGVRTPVLRKIAKRISKTDYKEFLKFINNETYEIIFLEGILISYIEEIDECILRLKEFSLKIDNWGICDLVCSSLKIIKKNKEQFLGLVNYFINSDYVFSKRLGFVLLLNYYVDREYLNLIFKYVKETNCEEYYVNMAISWLLCECYIKFPKETMVFLKNNKLNDFVVRKTISKVHDSYRVSVEDKININKLKGLVIK